LQISESTKMYGIALDIPEELAKENLDIILDAMLDN
jgi:hypothetical protein